jgi:phosphate transport system substrate-binding protein
VADVRFRIPRGRTIRRWAVVGAALLAVVVGSPVPAAAVAYVPISGSGSTWSSAAIDAWCRNVTQFGMSVSYVALGSTLTVTLLSK